MKDPSPDLMVSWLLEAFPEFVPEYLDEVNAIGQPETYYAYYVWVDDKLNAWISAGNKEGDLRRMFKLLECLATSDDKEAQNLLVAGVLESLPRSEPQLSVIIEHIGPGTRQLFEPLLIKDRSFEAPLDASRIRKLLVEFMAAAARNSNDPSFVKGALSWLEGNGLNEFRVNTYPKDLRYPLSHYDLAKLISFHSKRAADALERGDLRAANENTGMARYYLNEDLGPRTGTSPTE